jgi:threonine/homoserine efflux transporter RhtA
VRIFELNLKIEMTRHSASAGGSWSGSVFRSIGSIGKNVKRLAIGTLLLLTTDFSEGS